LDQAFTGNHLRERANQSEARVFYTDAIASTNEVLKIAPDNFTAWNVRYAVFNGGIAPLCEEQHDIAGALAAYESGLEAVEHVLASNSRNAEYQNYRGLALWKIGRLRRERGELVLAASAYTEAGRSFDKAASLNPTAARYHDSYGLFVEWMAPLRRQQKNRTATVEALQAGLNAAQRAANLEPVNAVHIFDIATAHLQLGNEWRDAGKNSEAVEAYAQAEHSFREAIRLKNNDAHYWYGLSEALTGLARVNGTENQSAAKERYQEALQAISKSTELDPHEASYRKSRTFLETQLQTPSRK
jgi:tetratricopeptide (TPR) repeat protein